MTEWSPATDVVELPDGRRIRGRALRSNEKMIELPDVGFYLLANEPAPAGWPMVWIEWRDFRLPSDRQGALDVLGDAFARCEAERVEIACEGGRGRTGCALAVLAILGGVRPDEAVSWVRDRYHPGAVEAPWQRRWIRRLDASRLRSAS